MNIMNHIHIWGVAALLLLVPLTSVDARTVVRTGDTVSIGADQSVDGNFYGLGGTVSASGKVDGDLFAAGSTVTLNGEVTEDILVVGGTVSVHGQAGDDVRVVGADVTLAEAVAGNVVIVGARVKILSSADITGDVLLLGGSVVIEGKVGGQVLGSANQLRIDGEVVGGVDVTTNGLVLGERANIAGDVRYVSTEEVSRATGATVVGDVVRSDSAPVEVTSRDARMAFVPFLVSLFATLSLYLLFRRQLERFTQATVASIGLSTMIGFATVILAPLVISILLVSILGMFVGLMALFLFLLGFVVTLSLMSAVCGGLLSQVITKKVEVNVLWISLGALTIQAILFIPVVGAVVFILLLCATLGGAVYRVYRLLR